MSTPEKIAADENIYDPDNPPKADTDEYDSAWDKLTGTEPEPIAAHPDNEETEKDPPAEPEETAEEKAARLEAELKDINHKLSSEIGRSTGLQNKLQELRTADPAPPAKVTEAALKNPEAWKLYQEDYPESAAAIESRMTFLEEKITNTVRNDMNAVIQPLQQSEADRIQQAETSALAEEHPDWQAVASSAEFGVWLNEQPVSVQGLIKSSKAADAAFLLATYKTATGTRLSAAAPKDPDQTEEAKALAAKRKRQMATGAAVKSKTRSARDPDNNIADNYDAAWDAQVKKREQQLRDQGRI